MLQVWSDPKHQIRSFAKFKVNPSWSASKSVNGKSFKSTFESESSETYKPLTLDYTRLGSTCLGSIIVHQDSQPRSGNWAKQICFQLLTINLLQSNQETVWESQLLETKSFPRQPRHHHKPQFNIYDQTKRWPLKLCKCLHQCLWLFDRF